MSTEYELKYKATPQTLTEVQAAFPENWVAIQMETAYYDTPSGALSSRRYTLRRRLENGVSVCTLKAPAGSARGEWEAECETIEKAIPKLIELGCPADLEQLAKEGLVHICGAKFTRLSKILSFPECTVELALDRGELSGGSRTEPLCEIETELMTGTVAACNAFGKALSDRFGLQAEEKSKFHRALSLYRGE